MATKKTNNKKSTSSTTKSGAKAEAKAKQPLLSTKKKVGIAIYFTFLATLALSFGIQIWLMDTFNPPATNEPNLTNTEQQNQAPNTQSNETNQSTQYEGSNIERALARNEQQRQLQNQTQQSPQQQEFITPAEDNQRYNLYYPNGALIEENIQSNQSF